MAIDFSKYSVQEVIKQRKWEPPVSEQEMKFHSRKLAISSRVYPEYLLAVYAFFESKYGTVPDSISELVFMCVSEVINQNRDLIPEIPNPDVSLDFLTMQGFLSPQNKENRLAISNIELLREEEEANLLSSNNPKDHYMYWKSRDPEKAEQILNEMSKEFFSDILGEDHEPPKVEVKKPAVDNTPISYDNFVGGVPSTSKHDKGVASLDQLDFLKTVPETGTTK